MNAATILAGIDTFQKIAPVIEAIGKEIGPLVETEVADGKVLWADVEKSFNDLKAAFAIVKSATQTTSKS